MHLKTVPDRLWFTLVDRRGPPHMVESYSEGVKRGIRRTL